MDLLPPPGRAFVEMDPVYGDYEGGIVIPRAANSRQRAGRVGVLIAYNLYTANQLSWVVEHGEHVARHAYTSNEQYRALLDKHVVCNESTWLAGRLYTVRLEQIECVVPEGAKADADSSRCRRCTTKNGAGLFLDHDGYCIQCGYNRNGEHKSNLDYDALAAQCVDTLVRQPMEEAHRRASDKAIYGRAISYPGQQRRDTIEAAHSEELNAMMQHIKQGGRL